MNFDQIVVDFVSNNYLTLTIIFTALKGIAKITPTAKDDKIFELFYVLFQGLKKKNT